MGGPRPLLPRPGPHVADALFSALPAAVAEKFLEARLGKEVMQHKVYAYISDGGVEEEISQGTGRIAGILGLNNLIMFYDSNEIQLSTECNVVMNEDTEAKYKAWGWNVIKINGNDADEIREALKAAQKEEKRPTLIIGKTVMGKGALKADGTSYEHNIGTHGAPLGGDAYVNTIKNLGGNPDDYSEIRIPDNMFIWATMNSADQGVFPMDTAFKRRWDFTYLGIDDSEAGIVGFRLCCSMLL